MEATLKEIAAILRSTEDMAAQFAKRVESRVGQPVSHAQVLAAMKKMTARNLSLDKVAAKIQQQHKQTSRRTSRRPAARRASRANKASTTTPSFARANGATVESARTARTLLEKLEAVLEDNWDRAEAEGLHPNRMDAEAFINAVYQYTDRREATRRRILQAAQNLDQDDVLLTPALVADTAHKLFEG